ncbi:hypothetical protein Droror1_Dr00028270, partial [Drosera rotundifolia]
MVGSKMERGSDFDSDLCLQTNLRRSDLTPRRKQANLISPVDVVQVGSYFVMQYYQLLQQRPEYVHKLYSDSSTMLRVHGHNREAATAMVEKRVKEAFDEFGGLGLGFRDGDVKLIVSSRDGFKFSIDVHSQVLTEKSRFFAEKLMRGGAVAQSVEICDCDDVEVYVEVVILMYSDDLKRSLMGEDVLKVLSLLQ